MLWVSTHGEHRQGTSAPVHPFTLTAD